MYPNFLKPFLSLLSFMLLSQSPAFAFDWPHQSSDLKPDPEIVFGELPNGMGYLIRPSSEPPNRISLRLVVQAGSLMETPEQLGLAHFLEHMAFNGTRNFEAGEMVQYFQRLGMAFGADTNASTGYDRTAYQLELPDGTEQLRRESLQLLRDYADGILFGPEEIEKERGIILSEKVSRDTVGFRTYKAEIGFLFPDALFADRLPIGEEEIIKTAPREDFVAFYEKWYRPGLTFLVVTGDVDPAVWEQSIRETFGSYGDGDESPLPEISLGTAEFEGVEAFVHVEPEAEAARFSLTTGRPLDDPPDTRARRMREAHLQILNAILSRRLERLARSEDSPIVSSYSYTYPFYDFAELSGISATVEPAEWEEGVRIVERELRRALAYGFAPAEVAEAEANLLKEAQQKVEGEETRQTSSWADEYASLINAGRVPLSPTRELEIAEEAVKRTTTESLQALLREIWADSGRRLFLTGPLPEEASADALLSVFETSAETPVRAPDALKDLEFPYRAEGSVEPATIETIEDPGLTQTVYPNGIRANWKQTDFEEDTIHIMIRVGSGGVTLPVDQPGITRLANEAFLTGGLGKISFDDLQTVTAGKVINTGFSVAEDAFLLQGKTRPQDLDLQLDILRAFLEDPGFRPEGLSFFRRNIDPTYRSIRSTKRGVLESQGWPFLYDDFGIHRFPTEEQLKKRNYAELEAWLRPAFESGYLEVSVVGDIEEEALRASLDRVFGTLPGPRPDAPRHEPGDTRPDFPAEETGAFSIDSDIPQGFGLVAFPSNGRDPIEESRTLSLLASVLDERLRVTIREETGQAYSFGVFHRPSEAYPFGVFVAIADLAPEQIEPVTREIFSIATRFDERPITEDERIRALAPNLKQLQDMRRTNPYWLRVISGSQIKPEQLEWARTILEGYESIGVDDLQSAAEEFLLPEKAATVHIRSE